MGTAGTVVAGLFWRNCGIVGVVRKIRARVAAEVREARRWTAFASMDALRVNYGFDELPRRTELISGGIVKCLDLAERFPHSVEQPNVLYLVSSVLPARRELLVRAAQRAGGKVVLNQNGVAFPAWAGVNWRTVNRSNARVHQRADVVIYQSEFCRRSAERFLGQRDREDVVLHNPVDVEVFAPSSGGGGLREMPILLLAGSHHDGYRVKVALEAVAHLQAQGLAVRLQVAGRLIWGEEAPQEAREWAKEFGVADVLEWRGPYSQAEAPELFRGADVLLHLKVLDPCPRLVVEAMACGLPVVYSATGGVPELVGEEGGVGIPGEEDFEEIRPPSAECVARATGEVLRQYAAFAKQARERAVRLFSLPPWIREHRRIFEALATER